MRVRELPIATSCSSCRAATRAYNQNQSNDFTIFKIKWWHHSFRHVFKFQSIFRLTQSLPFIRCWQLTESLLFTFHRLCYETSCFFFLFIFTSFWKIATSIFKKSKLLFDSVLTLTSHRLFRIGIKSSWLIESLYRMGEIETLSQ